MSTQKDKKPRDIPDTFIRKKRTHDQSRNEEIKDAGSTIKRSKYDEDIRVAELLIHLLTLQDVSDFKVWSKDECYGNFDDIIAEITMQNEERVKMAIRVSDEFNLSECFTSYKEAKKNNPKLSDYLFLLKSNSKTKEDWSVTMELDEGITVKAEPAADDLLESLLGLSYEEKPIKFTIQQMESERAEFEQFLDRFFYYPASQSEEATRSLAETEFKKEFLNTDVTQFFDFLHEWSKQDGKQYKLTKDLVSTKVAEYLISPFVQFHPEIIVPNSDLFKQVIDQFDGTLIDAASASKLGLIWNRAETIGIIQQLKQDFAVSINANICKRQPLMCQLLVWNFYGGHLSVSLSPENVAVISKALALCKRSGERKFIFVVNPPNYMPEFVEGNIFCNLDDLKNKDPELFVSIGADLKISLEGKTPIPLSEVLEDEHVRKSLTPSHFLHMLDKPLMIGEDIKQLSKSNPDFPDILSDENCPIHLICAEAGMGKTWYLEQLEINYPSMMLIRIEARNQPFFNTSPRNDEEYIRDFLFPAAFKTKSQFEEAIFKYLYRKRRIIILWDDIDKVAETLLPNVLNAVDYFKWSGLRQCLASRPFLQAELENKYCVTSRPVMTFDETQQKDYIKQRLKVPATNLFQLIVKYIMNQLNSNEDNDLFGRPLQLFLMTELFLDPQSNILDILTESNYSIATLYQHFIDRKFNIRKSETTIRENYEKAAVQVCFPMNAFKGVDVSCDQFLEAIMREGDPCGIITSVVKSDGEDYVINFAHYTFAEFLTAVYFAKHKKIFDNVDQKISGGRYKHIGVFYDKMMGGELVASTAKHLGEPMEDFRQAKDGATESKEELSKELSLLKLEEEQPMDISHRDENPLPHRDYVDNSDTFVQRRGITHLGKHQLNIASHFVQDEELDTFKKRPGLTDVGKEYVDLNRFSDITWQVNTKSMDRNNADNQKSAKYLHGQNTADTFVKRPGTIDVGKEYVDLKIAQIAINLLDREDVQDFHIWSDDAKYGSFDDVIVVVEWKTGTTTKVAIQLKHAANSTKTVTSDSIASSTGGFGLVKYFNDYQKAVKQNPQLADYIFLLQTNMKMSINKDTQLGEDLIIQYKEVDDPVASLLVNSSTTKPLKFVVKQTNSTKLARFTVRSSNSKRMKKEDAEYKRGEFEKFLQQLYFYPQQPNVAETRELCVEAFKKKFSRDESKPFIDFVQQWSKQDGKKDKLTKESMSFKVAESLISQYVLFHQQSNMNNLSEKEQLFMRVIERFNFTLIERASASRLPSGVDNWLEIYENNYFKRRIEHGSKQMESWRDSNGHLVVSLTSNNAERISKAFDLCNACGERRLILVIDSNSHPLLFKDDIFETFEDLKGKDKNLWQLVGDTLSISLEGKAAIPLSDVLDDSEVGKCLTPSHFLQMLNGPLLIGKMAEKLPDYYIHRKIANYSISFSYVDEMDADKNVALICSNVDFSQIQTKFPNLREWFDDINSDCSDDKSRNVFFCDVHQKERVFEAICKRNKSKHCVCLEYSEDERQFQWLQSTKIDPKVHQFRWVIPEERITTEDYPLNILCNDPGMGKSWFLKRLKRSFPSMIVIGIEPKMHEFFNKTAPTTKELDDFVLSLAPKEMNELEEAIFKHLYEKKRVVILWDGLDEASQEKLPNILDAVDHFKNIGLFQWIASRVHLREQLENRFNILSRSITILDENQQEDYIKQRLRNNEATINSCENITKKIMNFLRPNCVNQLFGIPLQLFMLTELFLHGDSNILEKLESGLFSLAQLYEYFFDEKFNFYDREKSGLAGQTANDQIVRLLLKNKRIAEDNFEKAAIDLLFFAKVSLDPLLHPNASEREHEQFNLYNYQLMRERFKDVDISCDQFLDDIIEHGDSYGIITSVTKDDSRSIQKYKIYFAHQTFAEFLAARYFTKHYENIYSIEYVLYRLGVNTPNVRLFFDLIMAEDSELHLAVLYKDVEKVKQLEKRPECKDRFGRNPLTLAAVQANYKSREYPLVLNRESVEYKYGDYTYPPVPVHDHVEPLSPLPKDDILDEIFCELRNHYEIDETDESLFYRISFDDEYTEEGEDGRWPVKTKELFESIPGPSYVHRYHGFPTKWKAVSTIPSLDEVATRCVFDGMKTPWDRDSPTNC